MIVEYYVTGTVTAVTNVPFLVLLSCIASGLTAGRFAYNSHSNKIINLVMSEGTYFGTGSALLALQPSCWGILYRGWKHEVRDMKINGYQEILI